ncbi:MAG: tetratricopeptide repeat protein [Desulfobulbaceae bacterium]|nr:tetratricopeptide repeat protein [Desulfobulbaceae bacterium]
MLYVLTFQAEFHFDDNAYLIESPEIQNISGCLVSLGNSFFRPDRMLVTLSFAINHAVHEFSLPGYHFFNILLHGLNGIILFFLLLRLSSIPSSDSPKIADKVTVPAAFGAALLFVVHPVAVHSVTYITQRHGLMATFFCLSGFYYYLKIKETTGSKRIFLGIFCLACFWGAVHSKPMALIFPLFVIAYEMVLVRRVCHTLRRLLVLCLPLLILVLAALVGYAFYSGLFSREAGLAGFRSAQLWSPWLHFLTESQVFLHYWKILFLPLPIWLSGDHYFPVAQSINSAVLLSWLTHILILCMALWAFLSKKRLITFGILWFYIALVPPYLLLPIKDVMVDYKTYLPSAGVAFIVAEGIRYFLNRYGFRLTTFILMSICILGCWGTIERNSVFMTEETFWTDVIEKYPQVARPYNNRGLAYHKKGDYSLAIADFKKALTVNLDYGLVHANLGDSYRESGKIFRAIEHYKIYVGMHPDKADGLVRLANMYARQKKWDSAIKIYKQAIKIEPGNRGALYNLALGYGHLKNYDMALHIFYQVLSLQPDNYKVLTSIGVILYQNGDKEKGKEYFEKALVLDPLFAEALYNLSACYAGEGNFSEAKELAIRLIQVDRVRGESLLRSLKDVKY